MAKPVKPTFGTNAVVPSSKLSTLADLADYGANPPGCIATRVAAFSLVNAAPNTIVFDTEVFDNAAMFAATSTTITATDAGLYILSGWIDIAANTTGMRSLEVNQNGGTIASEAQPPPSSFDARMSVTTVALAAAGDTFTLVGFQNSGGALNCTARIAVVRVSGT